MQSRTHTQDQSRARLRIAGRFLQCLILLLLPLSAALAPRAATAQAQVQTVYRYDAAGNVRSVTQTPVGSGNLPTLSTSLTFSNVPVGSSGTAQARLTNASGAAHAVPALNASAVSGDGFSFVSSDCPGTLPDGAFCSITVQFRPTLAGDARGSLKVRIASSVLETALFGKGVAAETVRLKQEYPGVVAGAGPVGWGPIPVNYPAGSGTFVLSNSGTSTATNLSIAASAPWTVQNNTCGTSLDGGKSCTYTLQFTPTAVQGYTGTLAVTSTQGNATPYTLQGSGVSNVSLNQVYPGVTAGAGPVGWGPIPVNYPAGSGTFVLTNSGTGTATSLSIAATAPWTVQNNSCGTSLAAGANCTYTLQFTPTAVQGYTGTLTVTSAQGNATAYTLTGSGGMPALTQVYPGVVAGAGAVGWGPIPVDYPAGSGTFVLSNSGTAAATGVRIAATAPWTVQNNTCGLDLGAGKSCSYTLQFKPTAVQSYSGTLTVTSTQVSATAYALQGSGVSNVSLSQVYPGVTAGAGPVGWGPIPVNYPAGSGTFVLTNSGTGTATSLSIAATAPWTVQNNTCGSSLAAGANCTYTLQFTPTAVQGYTGSLTVTSAQGNATAYVLQGSGVSNVSLSQVYPGVTAGAGPVGWGPIPVNYPAGSGTFVLTNSGTGTATSLSIAATAPWTVQNNTCGSSLAAGANCTYTLQFTPTAVQGYTGTLTVTSAQGSATPYTLSGSGGMPALTQVYPGVVAGAGAVGWGPIPVDYPAGSGTFVLSNSGTAAATGVRIAATAPWTVQNNTCGLDLGAGKSCSYTLQFKPTAVQSYSGTLTVTSTQVSATAYALQGSGVSNVSLSQVYPGVTAGAGPVGWGPIPVNYPAGSGTFVLTNSGTGTATSLSIAATAPWTVQNNTCGSSLAAGANCTYTLQFTPTAVQGYTGSLTVTSAQGNATAYVLQGSGVSNVSLSQVYPGVTAGAGSVGWGPIPVNYPAGSGTFVLTNSGTGTATSLSIAATAPWTVQNNSCGSSLAAGANCTYTLQFTPTAVQGYTGSLTVTSAQSNATAYVLQGSGVSNVSLSQVYPGVTAGAGSVGWGPIPVNYPAGSGTFVLTNSGTGTATSLSIAATAPWTVQNNSCGSSLAAGASCTYTLQFTPTAVQGYTGSLTVSSAQGNATAYALQGSGAAR